MQQVYVVAGTVKGYYHLMQYVEDITDHPQQECIERRLEIIQFFEKYGKEATEIAYKKKRSTIFLWKQKLKKAGGKLSALSPGDRSPKNKRHRVIPPFIANYIVDYRTAHPRADKVTITPSLTLACKKAGIKPVSESTVGRIIRDLKERGRLPQNSRLRMNGETGKLREIKPRQAFRKTRRKGFHPSQPGDLVEIDTVSIFTDGIKRYMFTAIDIKTRFAFAYAYRSNSSANGKDFLDKFTGIAPFPIRHIQTDNGSEFLKHFAQSCLDNDFVHFFNYPRHPQSNGHIERFNRTSQEQFVDWYTDSLDDPDVFNRSLMNYLIWYNTEKPHRGIGKKPPLRYYLEKFAAPEKSNMLWPLTVSCPYHLIYDRLFHNEVNFRMKKRVFSGARPTSRQHIGNLLGAINNYVKLQEEYDCVYCIVDIHALTTLQETDKIQGYIRDLALDWLAAGIDPRKSIVFVQSHVPEVTELHTYLSMLTPLSWLLRVPTFKEKAKAHPDNVNYGLVGYPVLMASDIVLYKAEVVPVGEDQLPHLEITREIARRFNTLFGETFPEPKAKLTEFPLIPSLISSGKMSKSEEGSTIDIAHTAEETTKRIMTAITDPARKFRKDPGHPEVCNIYTLHKYYTPAEVEKIGIECRAAGIGCVDCKKLLAKNMNEYLAPLRAKRLELAAKPDYIKEVLADGAERARVIARTTMKEVRHKMGLS